MHGLRVIDVSNRAAGGHLGRLLTEQGAEVIHVEPPSGNPTREHEPIIDGKSLYHTKYHLNKKGVSIDLSIDEGIEIFDELVRSADSIILDQPPDHPLRNEALDTDRLLEINDQLIITNVTPFGLTGPKSTYASTDLIIQAAGGFPRINGHPDRPPLRLPNNQAAHMGALNAMIATLSAVFHRDFNGGTGQVIDVSQHEAILMHLEHHVQLETFDGYTQDPVFPDTDISTRAGRFFTPGVVGLYPCEDGWVCMGAAQDHEVKALADFLGGELEEMVEQEKILGGMSARLEYAKEMIEAIDEQTESYTTEELEREGQKAKIAVSEVKSPAELIEDEHFNANDFIREIDDPDLGKIQDVGPGARTKTAKEMEYSPAPDIGEHNEEILTQLEISKPRIQELSRAEVI